MKTEKNLQQEVQENVQVNQEVYPYDEVGEEVLPHAEEVEAEKGALASSLIVGAVIGLTWFGLWGLYMIRF